MRVIILPLLCLLSGCFWNDKPPTDSAPPKVVEVVPYHPPIPRPIVLNDITWETLTQTTADSLLKDKDYSYMCLDWSAYLVLGQNMQSILSKLEDYEGVVCYYRKDLKEPRCQKNTVVGVPK